MIAIGNWTMGLWLLGTLCVWWFGKTFPELTDAAQAMFPNDPDLAGLFDPNSVNWDLRFQQVVVFLVVAVILAIVVRRYQNLVLESAEMSRERTNLARYFSPTMVEELSTKDEPLGQIRSHEAAVLFVDISGFTAYADGRPADEVIETLRAFHSRMESEVFAHRGTLDKYLGDGLMATFGTPLPADDDAACAVACVRAMVDRMEALNNDRRIEGLPEIDARFGLHFGPVVLGDIGATRLEFAVLGDTVNVASRLETATRTLGVRAIVSDATMAAAGDTDRFHRVADQTVRGVTEPLAVWVLG
ncbi:MAG: adenylate/guanylate cyclase domain-containing protein [Pseudomonadota bacterium]